MGTDEPKPGCHLCGYDEDVTLPGLVEHVRLMHPDAYGSGPERWPDGGVVVEDHTLDPGDFGGSS